MEELAADILIGQMQVISKEQNSGRDATREKCMSCLSYEDSYQNLCYSCFSEEIRRGFNDLKSSEGSDH